MDFEVTPLSKDNDTNNNVIQPNKPGFMPGRFNFDLNLRFVFIGAASIIAIGILFFFLGKASFGDDKVELRIEGPSEVKGGELVSFKVIYENKSSVDLKGVKLVFTYPDNSVVIKDGDVVDIENEFIDIGELKNGKSEEMEFKAYIVGDRGNVKQARASITFTPSNLSSVLKKDVALPMTITSLPVELTLVAPPTATDGQSITYILDYRNQTDGDIKNLRINVKFPDLFGVIKNTPQATIGSTWDIETLKSDEGSRITMLGTIRGNERESKIISATLQRKIETPDGEMYIDFARAEATTAISSPYLSATLNVNGSRSYVASLGDIIEYTVDFRNNTNNDLVGLNLSVKLDGAMFDFSTVESSGFFDSRVNTIFWNASVVPELSVLRANQSGSVKFKVRLKRDFPGGVIGSQNSAVKTTAVFDTSNVPPDLGLDVLRSEDELVTRIASDASFKAGLLISDSVWGSNGPFPPRVDQKTMFTIRLELINPVNLISPAKVTTFLPPGVVWENNVRVSGGSGQPVYDSRDSSVTWDVGSLPGGVGSAFPTYQAYFQVSITPSVNQVGQSVKIVDQLKFEGTDTFTKQQIIKTIKELTTARTEDRGSGSVQQ